MDLLCPRCTEPWENDYFHEHAKEIGTTYRELVRDFQRRGCLALGQPERECQIYDEGISLQISALYDLLGDDTDGAAAMLEDLDLV